MPDSESKWTAPSTYDIAIHQGAVRNGSAPAYPGATETEFIKDAKPSQLAGFTKREALSAQMFAAIISGNMELHKLIEVGAVTMSAIADTAVACADELLETWERNP